MSLALTSIPVRTFTFKREIKRRAIISLEGILGRIPAGVRFTTPDVHTLMVAEGSYLEPESLANLLIEVSRTHAGLGRTEAKPPIYEFNQAAYLEPAPIRSCKPEAMPPAYGSLFTDDEQHQGPVALRLRRMEAMLEALCKGLGVEMP